MISGGGPVGLITAAMLYEMLPNTHIVVMDLRWELKEKKDSEKKPLYSVGFRGTRRKQVIFLFFSFAVLLFLLLFLAILKDKIHQVVTLQNEILDYLPPKVKELFDKMKVNITHKIVVKEFSVYF